MFSKGIVFHSIGYLTTLSLSLSPTPPQPTPPLSCLRGGGDSFHFHSSDLETMSSQLCETAVTKQAITTWNTKNFTYAQLTRCVRGKIQWPDIHFPLNRPSPEHCASARVSRQWKLYNDKTESSVFSMSVGEAENPWQWLGTQDIPVLGRNGQPIHDAWNTTTRTHWMRTAPWTTWPRAQNADHCTTRVQYLQSFCFHLGAIHHL